MTMNNFVASCLFMDGKVFDEYAEAFGVDDEITQEDVHDALDSCCGAYLRFGEIILSKLWGYVIESYAHILDADKFDCDFSSPSFPCFYYDEERVYSKEDLDKIAEKQYS